jgi:hypothetical protein
VLRTSSIFISETASRLGLWTATSECCQSFELASNTLPIWTLISLDLTLSEITVCNDALDSHLVDATFVSYFRINGAYNYVLSFRAHVVVFIFGQRPLMGDGIFTLVDVVFGHFIYLILVGGLSMCTYYIRVQISGGIPSLSCGSANALLRHIQCSEYCLRS